MSSPTPSRLNVLVVDDDEDTSALLGIVLGRQGYKTTFATGVKQAGRALDTGNFVALVTDLRLPDGSGLTLLSNGRRSMLRAAVVISGAGARSDRRESERYGFDAHLVKPLDAAELCALLSRLLRLPEFDGVRELQRAEVEDES
jgi:DNA-binding response OmpR family regulator